MESITKKSIAISYKKKSARNERIQKIYFFSPACNMQGTSIYISKNKILIFFYKNLTNSHFGFTQYWSRWSV